MNLIKYFLCITSLTITSLHAMDEETKTASTLTVYTIEGLSGGGLEENYIKKVLGDTINVINLDIPKTNTLLKQPDLGQKTCQSFLHSSLQNVTEDGIIYAASQGTGTILNYLGNHPKKTITIKALILDSILSSGNDAIHRTATGPLMANRVIKVLANAPGSYYFAPYFAKFSFNTYRPAGQQPIKSLKNIPPDIPIIIAHSKKDPQTSYKGACAMYYGLRAGGNNNVYFITKEEMGHVRILNTEKDYKLVRQILSKHGVLNSYDNASQELDLNEYQPDPEMFKSYYDDLLAKESNHTYVERGLIAIGATTLAFGAHYVRNKLRSEIEAYK